ncbi:Glutathione S-transferase omega-1 [Microtus ochrogaster]|uniref:Glutathione S-transferase omega-1 n=1 Tax=Microtus ochrogaster TaxID=79684 RepID=A0A8J6G238_MICOH|nr:Glutathione S-transferase omega-1 [Microtus ochrogaster]
MMWLVRRLSQALRCIAHTPNLKLWMAAMQKDPTVSSDLLDAKSFRGFLSLYLQDSHEACDYGL